MEDVSRIRDEKYPPSCFRISDAGPASRIDLAELSDDGGPRPDGSARWTFCRSSQPAWQGTAVLSEARRYSACDAGRGRCLDKTEQFEARSRSHRQCFTKRAGRTSCTAA